MDGNTWDIWLAKAIVQGKGKIYIDSFLAAGLDVNALRTNGHTVLSNAARYGDPEIVEYLVQKGANSDMKNADGSIPLHVAAKCGHADIVEYFYNLCGGKCDLNVRNSAGETPLLLAAQSGRKRVVQLLVRSGADVEFCDSNGWTVLHFACLKGWLDTVQFLVNKNCNLNVEASYGATPLMLAGTMGRRDIVVLLVESGADAEFCDDNGFTVFHVACVNGWLDIVQFFVNKKCNLNVKTSYGLTPLMLAGSMGRRDIVVMLVESGADVVQCSAQDGWTALHYASSHGWLEVVRAIIKKGANLNAVNSKGETPLHIACKVKRLEIINYLLEAGANCNVIDDNGWTTLHYACDMGWLDTVQFLVNKKCSLNVKTKGMGDTPLLLAWSKDYTEIVALLVESGADVEQGFNPDEFTLMHYTCGREEWVGVVRALIRNGTDLNAVDSYGEAPLHIACREKCLEIMKHLLEAGANWSLEDGDDTTAFDYCIEIAPSVEGIGLFVKNGAYFEGYEYVNVYKNALLKDPILKNIELCSQSIINKFNNKDLPTFYALPGCGEHLPPIEKMRIVHGQSVAHEIEKFVESDIYTKGYYNLKESCPTVLKLLSVKALIHYYR